MKLEKLEVSNRKNKLMFILGALFTLVLVILINYLTSRASYRNTQSIPLMTGTINYSVKNVNHIYVKEDTNGSYKEQSNIPKGNYELNTSQSYCTKKPSTTHLSNITFNYNASLGTIDIKGIPEIKAICHIYFDKKLIPSEETLAKLEELSGSSYAVKEQTTFSGTSSDTSKVVYKLEDNDGETYVFRGNPDNWVTFANKTWRIIRINGDGTLRLLYYCSTTSCNSPENAIESKYNPSYGNNTYVGFYYGSENGDYNATHFNTTPSTIATELKTWYQSNLETSYKDYLSETTGWCNDRELSSGTGTGTTNTDYAPMERFYSGSAKTTIMPKLTCNNNDWFTVPNSGKVGNQAMTLKTTSGNYVPVGLITADEAGIGGLLYYKGGTEESSYVSAGSSSNYWTMSPSSYYSFYGTGAIMLRVSLAGYLEGYGVNYANGVRPVINVNLDKIKSITGKGTSSSQFAIT